MASVPSWPVSGPLKHTRSQLQIPAVSVAAERPRLGSLSLKGLARRDGGTRRRDATRFRPLF